MVARNKDSGWWVAAQKQMNPPVDVEHEREHEHEHGWRQLFLRSD